MLAVVGFYTCPGNYRLTPVQDAASYADAVALLCEIPWSGSLVCRARITMHNTRDKPEVSMTISFQAPYRQIRGSSIARIDQ